MSPAEVPEGALMVQLVVGDSTRLEDLKVGCVYIGEESTNAEATTPRLLGTQVSEENVVVRGSTNDCGGGVLRPELFSWRGVCCRCSGDCDLT